MSEQERMIRAAGVVGLATLLSRVVGVGRDMAIAYYLGARLAGEAFVVAFRIPNLLRGLLAEGSLAISFIPVFTEYLTSRSRPEADRLVNIVFSFLLLALVAATVLGIVFAPWIVHAISPGFLAYPEKLALTVRLTRYLFPYIFFVGLVALCMGVLNTLGHFAAPALAPVFLNLCMIGSLVLLASHFQEPSTALALGVLVGGAVQLLFQFPFLQKKEVRLRLDLDFSHPGARQIGRLMVPRLFGVAVAQITVFFNTFLASYCEPGSNFYLFYADRLMELPLGVFAIALGTAALPSFSRQSAHADSRELVDNVSFALRTILFINLPAMVGLIVLGHPIIQILFERGEFDAHTTSLTYQALICYTVGLWAYSALRVVVPAFYSLQDTKTPVKAATLALAAHVLFSLLLILPLGFRGLALSSALSAVVNLSFLVVALRRRLGRIDGRAIRESVLRAGVASGAMGGVAYLAMSLGSWAAPGTVGTKALVLGGTITLSLAVYVAAAYCLRSSELGFLTGMGRRFLSRCAQGAERNPRRRKTRWE